MQNLSPMSPMLRHKGISPRNITVVHMDAGAFGLQPRPLTSLLDEVEARLLCSGGARLKREMPYRAWRDLVSRAGPPAVLALALCPRAQAESCACPRAHAAA